MRRRPRVKASQNCGEFTLSFPSASSVLEDRPKQGNDHQYGGKESPGKPSSLGLRRKEMVVSSSKGLQPPKAQIEGHLPLGLK